MKSSRAAETLPLKETLIAKEYVVIPELGFQPIAEANVETEILVIQCNEAGTTTRGFGWSQIVNCPGTDLASGDVIYSGISEFMGDTVAADFAGATRAALAKLASGGTIGRVVSIAEVNRFSHTATSPPREPATVRSGTGFFLDRQGSVVTNAHVVLNCREIHLFYNDRRDGGSLVFADRQSDIAVLSTPFSPRRVAVLSQEREAELEENVMVAACFVGSVSKRASKHQFWTKSSVAAHVIAANGIELEATPYMDKLDTSKNLGEAGLVCSVVGCSGGGSAGGVRLVFRHRRAAGGPVEEG